jgi:hypothetical protein
VLLVGAFLFFLSLSFELVHLLLLLPQLFLQSLDLINKFLLFIRVPNCLLLYLGRCLYQNTLQFDSLLLRLHEIRSIVVKILLYVVYNCYFLIQRHQSCLHSLNFDVSFSQLELKTLQFSEWVFFIEWSGSVGRAGSITVSG